MSHSVVGHDKPLPVFFGLADPSFTTLEMKKRLKWYYSTECKLLAENWLRQYFADCYTRS